MTREEYAYQLFKQLVVNSELPSFDYFNAERKPTLAEIEKAAADLAARGVQKPE